MNLANSSSQTCVTGGYVGVRAYDPAGAQIAASELRDPLGDSSPPTLYVSPGDSVHFTIGLPTVRPAGGTQCSTKVGVLHLIPPNETTEVQIATPVRAGYPLLCGAISWWVRSKRERSTTERIPGRRQVTRKLHLEDPPSAMQAEDVSHSAPLVGRRYVSDLVACRGDPVRPDQRWQRQVGWTSSSTQLGIYRRRC